MKVNGQVIRALRAARGMSVSELAKRVGTTQPHISNIEMEDRGCSPKMLVAIADALHVEAAMLDRNRDFPNPELHLYLKDLAAEVA